MQYQDLVRQEHISGFELGDHTFSHSDLASLPQYRRTLEVDLTSNALAGIIGIRPRLVRPPYSSVPDAVRASQKPALASVARRGYILVLADFDSEDWRRPGWQKIVENATPPTNSGGIVLMHDGGGDRSQTVDALNHLIPNLRSRGFQFVAASDLAQIPRSQVEVSAAPSEHREGSGLVGALSVARAATKLITGLAVGVAALVVLRALVLFAFASRHTRRQRQRAYDPTFCPAVSVVVPAFNEALVIERAVTSLAASNYPQLEILVVDDGSTDATGELVEDLDLENVRVIYQANAGKAAALNRGISEARHSILAMVDADTVFEADSLRLLVQPFADPRVGAVSGNTKVGNRQGFLGLSQHIEYVIGFNYDRRFYDVLGCIPTVPGAIGAFRRSAVVEVGGASDVTLAEDTDLTLALARAGWEVTYAEEARGWTEAPTTFGGLWRQRYRWSYGTMQALFKHRAALWRRGEGRIGRRAMPYMLFFQILLPLAAPLIDLVAIYAAVFSDPYLILLYFGAFNVLALGQGIYAFRLDRESLRPLWLLPLQQLVYRQLSYLVLTESVRSALFGLRLAWQTSDRSGQLEDAPKAPSSS